MKPALFGCIAMIALCAPPAASGSPLAKRAAHSDGLLDFILGDSSEIALPIEQVSGGGGRIACAHVRASGKSANVSGLVQRQSHSDPPPWAHVDVLVFDPSRKLVEAAAVHYSPRDIPHSHRSGFAQSRYSVRLKALPAAGSTLKVVFHPAPKSECEFREKL